MLRIFLALWLAITPAFAWAGSMTLLGVGVVAGGALPTLTNTTSVANRSCGFVQTCPIPSVVVPSGFVVFAVTIDDQQVANATFSSVALSAGCSGTLTQAQANTVPGNGGVGSAVFYGTVTGGTCTVSITSSVSGSIASADVSLGLLSNLTSTTPGTGCQAQYPGNQGSPYACSGSITVASGGFGICAIGANQTPAMTSATQTIDSQSNGTAFSGGIGHITATGTPDFSSNAFAQAGIACAPWR